MNPVMHKSTFKQKRNIAPLSMLWLWLVSITAQAQLPTPVDPSSGAPNGNYLAFMQGWSGDADLSPEIKTMTSMRFPINLAGWRSHNEETLHRRTDYQGHQRT